MDAAEVIERNSRWDREPVTGKDGKPVIGHITERDLEIFRLLARYRYLPADYIHAFVKGDYQSLIKRLNLLYRKPNLYIDRPAAQRENADANYRKLIYELDDKGAQLLRDRGNPIPKSRHHGYFGHALMECQIASSIELGTRDNSNVKLISWPAIVSSDQFPETTRRLSNPFRIQYGNAKEDALEPDWEPFVIARMKAETTSFTFFPGFEADCDTESLESERYAYASIRSKFKGYLAIIERRVYQSHYGATQFMVPFITTSESRMQAMMGLLDRILTQEPHEKGIGKRFIFKHMPAFTSRETAPPTGHMLTTPWKRVGFTDYDMTQ